MEKQPFHVRHNNQFQSQRVLRPVPQPFLTIMAHKKLTTNGQEASVRKKVQRANKTWHITLNQPNLGNHLGFKGAKVLRKRPREIQTAETSSSHSLQKDLGDTRNFYSTPTLTTSPRFIYSLVLYQKRTPGFQENSSSSAHNRGLQSRLVRKNKGRLKASGSELGVQTSQPQTQPVALSSGL